MAFERFYMKKVYYYVICAVTLFVLMWGAVDIISSALSLSVFKPPSVGLEASAGAPSGAEGKAGITEPFFDEYYQSRMAFDRMGDSAARIIVAGIIFSYAGFRIRELEGKEI
ncbi:MAG: hypothetical protein ABH860_00875 [bacterium]